MKDAIRNKICPADLLPRVSKRVPCKVEVSPRCVSSGLSERRPERVPGVSKRCPKHSPGLSISPRHGFQPQERLSATRVAFSPKLSFQQCLKIQHSERPGRPRGAITGSNVTRGPRDPRARRKRIFFGALVFAYTPYAVW